MAKRSSSIAKKTDPETSLQEDDVYRSFARWTSARGPKWHPVKKMRYVFWRMTRGKTVTDAIREIHWDAREFWTIVESDFTDEYKSAKILQSRAMADSLITISEGRDVVSRRMRTSLQKKIKIAVRRAKSNKGLASMLMKTITESISENQRDLIARNKLQMDAAKWHAGKSNPGEFGEKTSIGIGGFDPSGTGLPTGSITVAFVAPDGTEVPFAPKTGDDT